MQASLERARANEERAGAADARRWLGVRSIVEARDLLRTLFRLAADGKALVGEAKREGADRRGGHVCMWSSQGATSQHAELPCKAESPCAISSFCPHTLSAIE